MEKDFIKKACERIDFSTSITSHAGREALKVFDGLPYEENWSEDRKNAAEYYVNVRKAYDDLNDLLHKYRDSIGYLADKD